MLEKLRPDPRNFVRPNLFERAGIVPAADWRATYIVRQERIKKEGSEFFTWKPGATDAGVTASIEVGNQFPRARKYQPLDWLQIVNNEAVIDLTLIINGGESLPVIAGSIITVDNKHIWQVGVKNDHATTTTTANKIIVTLQRQPMTADGYARKVS